LFRSKPVLFIVPAVMGSLIAILNLTPDRMLSTGSRSSGRARALLSIFAHRLSASPGIRLYAR
jgi:hypothetical protein